MSCDEEEFCKDYLVLNPKEASFGDLVRIFCSSQLQKRDFFDAPKEKADEKIKGFGRRWIIFISVILQMLLLHLKKPLASFGFAFEMWLNYPSTNGGYLHLLYNFLTGKVVNPDSKSSGFRSLSAYLDPRLDLDKKISKEDDRYGAALSIMASKLVYENQAFAQNVVTQNWQMEFLGFFSFWNDYEELNTTKAIIFKDKSSKLIVVSFRGTNPFDADDWRTDIDLSWYNIEGVGKIHSGFMKALGLQKNKGWPKEIDQQNHNNNGTTLKQYAYYTIRDTLKQLLQDNKDAKFLVTGHSLGGALAILFTSILAFHEEKWLLDRMKGVYTFGQPRVGDEKFGEVMKAKLMEYDVEYVRYVYCNDMVPRLPYDDDTFLFKHFGSCLYFNSIYNGQMLEEEPNKNYFSLLWALPKALNAGFELMRSFVVPLIRGMEYKESLIMILYRMVGLVIPGLVAHSPLDYVNLTRLGTLTPSHSTHKQD